MKQPKQKQLLLWFLPWLLLFCDARFVVEKNSLTVTSPESIKGNHDSAIGNFGIPQYGGSMAGTVVYPKENQKSCKEFSDFSISFKSQPGALPTFLLVDRGAMVTGEFYSRKDLFPGFGRPFVYYANILRKVGRNSEAKDAARVALKSPWWTLGCPYEEVASIAQWEDEQIEFIKEKVSDEGRFEDLKKGKDPIQVSLDVAAFLLDLASIEGTWSESLDHIATCYEEAGLDHISKFVLYRD